MLRIRGDHPQPTQPADIISIIQFGDVQNP